ncbi:MAG: aminoglycoside phosphotransferase [Anaerocolumna sp.]|jgi:predicted N-acetyltransferase YhbS|nr:aminoglycoside phosphotransferase [Anaerocolumna sp.]
MEDQQASKNHLSNKSNEQRITEVFEMIHYKIKRIETNEYDIIRNLDRDAFQHNERGSDGDFHEVFADNIRRSPYYIPELDLVAVTDDDFTYLGHAIFSALPMGDNGEHIVWLNSLAVKHSEYDNHTEVAYEYQHEGIGTALVMKGLEIAISLGFTGCMTCGNPAFYQEKMGFLNYRELGITKDDSVDEPEDCVFAMELVPGGFDKTNKLLKFSYYDFTKVDDVQIKAETLSLVLSKMLNKTIIHASYQTKQLQGGTLGDVRLVTGFAKTTTGETLPYKVVWKKQNKWERPGDPNSWRREYDLYQSNLGSTFIQDLRWPICYHSELLDETIELWIEYIDGVSGSNLTLEMLEQAALELGRFQGKLAKQHDVLMNITCLGDEGFLEREFNQWHNQTFSYDFLISEQCRLPGFLKQMLVNGDLRLVDGKSFEYGCLRSKGCDIPEYIKRMLYDIDDNKDELFNNLKHLPVVLCHRDFWNENIFFSDGEIRLIDWDTTGFGYLGEDIASLIVDGMDVTRFEENYHKLIPAYLKGLSEYMEISELDKESILIMILIKFGYRMMQEYMFSDDHEDENWGLDALQKIYEIGFKK